MVQPTAYSPETYWAFDGSDLTSPLGASRYSIDPSFRTRQVSDIELREMAEQTAIQLDRPDEPQCYNCGGIGHWAVACPEPTRKTPAGLEAWRNSSAGRQGNSRVQQPDGTRSAGAIITKYPPPTSAGYNSNYPPEPGYPPQHSQYSHSGPSPTSSQYSSRHHYPSGHGGRPPPPPPLGHGQHHYPPSSYAPGPDSSYSAYPHHQSYSTPSPGYAPPPVAQSYNSYTYPAQENQQYAPPRPAYNSSFSKGSGGGQKRRNQRPTPPNRNPATSPPKTPSSQGTANSPARPAVASLSLPMTHALPPKPPKSVHDHSDYGRDQRNNKRKHDYQNRTRDIKDHHPGRGQMSTIAPATTQGNYTHYGHGNHYNEACQNRSVKQPGHRRRSSAGSHTTTRPEIQRQSDHKFGNAHNQSTQSSLNNSQERGRNHNNERNYRQNNNNHHQLDQQHSHESVRPKAVEKASSLNKDIPSLPPKPGTTMHENAHKLEDSVSTFASDGVSRGMERQEQAGERRKNGDISDHYSCRIAAQSESAVYEDVDDDDDRRHKRVRRMSRERSRSTNRYRDSDDVASHQRRRSRSLQQRSSPSRSSKSRSSSRSSRSSDLNSIEAELLGIASRRASTDSEPRRRPERVTPAKVKRRKATNSAFSRRW